MKLEQHNKAATGFKTPEGYFDNLGDRMFVGSRLRAKANTKGFTVPNHYFDALESNIATKLKAEKAPKVISLFNKKSILYASSIAATVALLVTLTLGKTNVGWNSLDAETVENYMLLEDLDTYEIANLLPIENLDETDFVNFSEAEIETYLLNNTDIEDLIIEEN
ncbi:MAG: hypothetical protein ACK5NB_00725 [Flavobacteriaceae bacterium]